MSRWVRLAARIEDEVLDEFGSGGGAFDNEEGGAFWGDEAAGALLVAADTGRVLVALRSADVNEPHTWGTIGGAIDEGEDPASAVRRELAEELGASVSGLVPAYVFRTSGFAYHNFIGILSEEDPTLAGPSGQWENDEFRWFSLEELMKLGGKHPGLKALLADGRTMATLRSFQPRGPSRAR